MLVVLPFYQQDIAAAERQIDWALELDGGKVNHDCLLSVPRGTTVASVLQKAQRYFSKVDVLERDPCPYPNRAKWPVGQNWAFQTAARHIATSVRRPFFWWETDAVLLRKGALDSLETEWKKAQKPFMGFVWPERHQMNGVAIYPAHVAQYSVRCMLCREAPWDVVLSKDAIAQVHPANFLIYRKVQQNGGDLDAKDLELIPNLVANGCCVFHGCKTDAVIRKIKGMVPSVKSDSVHPPIEPVPCREFSWGVPVSILLPTKDDPPQHLRDCWRSIIAQTHSAWNLVIVDDSKDKSTLRELASIACHPHVQLVRSRNVGLASALNLGLTHCKTELVARIDADDMMLPDRLRLQVERFIEDPKLDVLGGEYDCFGNTDQHVSFDPSVSMDYLAKTGWGTSHPTVMFRKSSVELAGGYNRNSEVAEDLDLWVRMISSGMRIANLKATINRHRRHAGQKSATEPMQKAIDDTIGPYRKRKRACFITEVLGTGGTEQWLLNLIRCTSSVVSWVVVAESVLDEGYAKQLAECAQVLHGDYGPDAASKSDILMFWFPMYRLSVYRKSQPSIIVSHTCFECFNEAWFKDMCTRWRPNDVNVGVGVAETSAKVLRGFGFPNVKVIPNSMPAQYYENPILKRPLWRAANSVSGFVVGYVGRISAEKGTDVLPDVVMRLPSEASILVMGQTWPPNEMNQAMQELYSRSKSRLRCLGWRNDVPEFLNSCDMLILPSKRESFSLVLMEAWLSNLPVLCTNVGVVQNHPRWATITDGSVDDLVKKINQCIENPPALSVRSRIAREVSTRYSFSDFRKSWCDLISSFIK